MKRQYLNLFFVFVIKSALFSQTAAPLATICSLPGVINESSGIEKTGPNTFWSHNDSGGQPAIYKFDSSGVLLKTLTISNATNIDWEDLAQDNLANMYIGDFGNNNNDRSVANGTPLKIYKISPPDLIVASTTTAGIINYEYADRNFSAPSNNHNFDMESFFFFNDSLHLFTKNRTNPTNGWIKHYILPSVPGTYTAMVVDSFNNGGVRITSADISPNFKTVALLSNAKVWLFSCYKGTKFISTGTNTTATLPNTQKEAFVFSNDSVAYITDEFASSVGQKLYRSNLKTLINKPIAFTSTVNPTCSSNNTGQILLTVFGGNPTYTYSWSNAATTATNSPLSAGNYSVIITDSKGCVIASTFTINSILSPTLITASTSSAVCVGQSVTLTVNGANTYTWNTSSNSASISVSPTVSTTYSVNGTSLNGCVSTTTISIQSNSNPTVSVNSATICSGQTTTLTATGASNYTWNPGGSNGSTFTISALANSTFSVTGNNGTCTATQTTIVNVNPNPTLTAISNASLLCIGQVATLTVSGASTYTWNPGGVGNVISVSPTVTSNYSVTGTNSFGCITSSMLTQTVSNCIAVSELAKENSITTLYPNPNNGTFNINVNTDKDLELIIFNTFSQIVYKGKLLKGNNLLQLNAASGIYYYNIIGDEQKSDRNKMIIRN